MTITRDIIRVFYHTIMAVCSTVYIHLYWGSQKTESIILGSCFCWDHLQLGNSHIVSMTIAIILKFLIRENQIKSGKNQGI